MNEERGRSWICPLRISAVHRLVAAASVTPELSMRLRMRSACSRNDGTTHAKDTDTTHGDVQRDEKPRYFLPERMTTSDADDASEPARVKVKASPANSVNGDTGDIVQLSGSPGEETRSPSAIPSNQPLPNPPNCGRCLQSVVRTVAFIDAAKAAVGPTQDTANVLPQSCSCWRYRRRSVRRSVPGEGKPPRVLACDMEGGNCNVWRKMWWPAKSWTSSSTDRRLRQVSQLV